MHGPVMSADPGKVEILDARHDGGRDVFLCQFLKSRIPEKARRPFHATARRGAVWFDELASGDGREAGASALTLLDPA